MTVRFVCALALLTTSACSGSNAQVPPSTVSSGCVTKAAIGRWLYDPQGSKFGSVRALTNAGQSATIMVSSYFEPGSHEAVVPACEITVAADGRVMLRRETVEALNGSSRR